MIKASLRALFRLTAIVIWTFSLWVFYVSIARFDKNWQLRIVRIWRVSICRLVGLKVWQEGTPEDAFLVLNHISYLDIFIVGQDRDLTFIAKSDVENWPIIGYLAKLVGTIFIQRKSKLVNQQIYNLEEQINSGKQLCLFPEGTSSNGRQVLPFKSSLFHAMILASTSKDVKIQPVSIAYQRHMNGAPMSVEEQKVFPWVGEDTLVRHLWEVLKSPGAEVDVRYHPSFKFSEFKDRKSMAYTCWQATSSGVEQLRAKRPYCPPRKIQGRFNAQQILDQDEILLALD